MLPAVSPDFCSRTPMPVPSADFGPVRLRGCKNTARSVFLTGSRKRRSRVVLLARAISLVCLLCTRCFVSLFLVVSTSAVNYLQKFILKMTCYVSSGTLNPTHSLTHSLCRCRWFVHVRYLVYTGTSSFFWQCENFDNNFNTIRAVLVTFFTHVHAKSWCIAGEQFGIICGTIDHVLLKVEHISAAFSLSAVNPINREIENLYLSRHRRPICSPPDFKLPFIPHCVANPAGDCLAPSGLSRDQKSSMRVRKINLSINACMSCHAPIDTILAYIRHSGTRGWSSCNKWGEKS